jgi:hypothetical protein
MAQQRRDLCTTSKARNQADSRRTADAIVAELERDMADAVRRHALLARLVFMRRLADLAESSIRFGDREEVDAVAQEVLPRIGAAIYAIARRLRRSPRAGQH